MLNTKSTLTIAALLLALNGFFTPASAQDANSAIDADAPSAPADSLSLDELRALADVFNLVRNNYVDEVSEADLLDSAMQGMLASLDPHSAYLEAEQFTYQDGQSRGEYGGVGIETEIINKRLIVRRVFRTGPAYTAGVVPGDMIVAVDGQWVRGRPLDEVIKSLSGEPDSDVVLRIRSQDNSARSITMTRELIAIPSVQGVLLDDDIAYLELNQFHLHSAEEFELQLNDLRNQSERGLAGIVLDLRDNPGGVIKAAMDVADGFLERGLVVYTKGRYPESQLEFHAEPGEWASGVPLAILINQNSASSAEILAAALQDHERATLIGSKTYGKGTVQSVLVLRNGGAIKLTTARYFSPEGRRIDGIGLEPDVTWNRRAEKAEEDNNAPELIMGSGVSGLVGNDPGVKQAISLIRAGKVRSGS